ncbi:hypothetical protein [Lacticaseibacillus kribbianus]|uniref:hypothetical protein n=1 Tax=Lacticaseibacillus kribbianus TaxID=2926292 RepID=UPI001CD3C71B|nr:hypothetical protein [Lacticaseibacillus kribbianus]
MSKLLKGLYILNVVGALGYLAVCVPAYLAGHPIYPGQAMLFGQVVAGIVLALLPLGLERLFHFGFPSLLKVIYECFILASVLLGTGMQFYSIPYWDKFLHLFSAALLGGLGLAIFMALTPKDQRTKIDPRLLAIFAVSFGVLLGVFWEFYEFTGDGLFGLNMQRYASGHTLLAGRAALMDTMGDLFADVFGAALLGLATYFGVRRDPKWLETFMFTKR